MGGTQVSVSLCVCMVVIFEWLDFGAANILYFLLSLWGQILASHVNVCVCDFENFGEADSLLFGKHCSWQSNKDELETHKQADK